jgi:tRNA threonylcarbamoyladenosine biosynthesis protein TsaE
MTIETRQFQLYSDSEADTLRWGLRIGQALRGPTVISLTGELGCGKTCFVKGLAQGLAVPDHIVVTSPTFALIHEYPGRLPLVHVDLYRLEWPSEFEDIGLFEIMESPAVVAIEWGERLADELPEHRLDIRMIWNGDRRLLEHRAYGLVPCDLLRRVEISWKVHGDG